MSSDHLQILLWIYPDYVKLFSLLIVLNRVETYPKSHGYSWSCYLCV